MFATLVRKELHLLRPVLIAMAIVFALLYVVLPIGGTIRWFQWNFQPRLSEFSFGTVVLRLSVALFNWITYLTPLAWVATLLLMPVLACNAFALEQRERWNELVIMLPLPAERRSRIKLVVFGGIAIGLVLFNLVVSMATVVLHTTVTLWSDRLLQNDQLGALAELLGVSILAISVAIFFRKGRPARLLGTLIIVFVCLGIAAYVVRFSNDALNGSYRWHFQWHRMWAVYTTGNMMAFLSLAVGSFGLAWLLSAVTRSPTLSSAISLGVVNGLFVLFDGMRMVVNMWGTFPWLVFATITGFGLACVATGQLIQSRNAGTTEVLL